MNTDIDNLEKLLLSEDLEELNLKTKHFNIFNALKLQNAEIRHSNFLAWLMTPYETHELGDYFLKEFLKSAIKHFSLNEKTNLCLSDIALNSFNNAEIRREYKNIDILVVDNENDFVCVVENKTWTKEHDNQLLRYAKIINEEFVNYKKLFVFLTPPESLESFNELIERKDDNICCYYIPMSYEQVFEAIDKTLRFNDKRLNADVKTFIEHYKNMIERSIMRVKDKEIDSLCRKIYRENKDAINIIMESVSSSQQEIDSVLENIINENTEINFEPSVKYWKRFTPKSVDFSKLNFAKITNDMNSEKIIVLEINNYDKEQLSVDIIVRTSDDKEKLNKVMQVAKEMFDYSDKTNNYAHVLSKPLVHTNEYYDFISNDDIASVLKNRLEQSDIISDFEKFAKAVSDVI